MIEDNVLVVGEVLWHFVVMIDLGRDTASMSTAGEPLHPIGIRRKTEFGQLTHPKRIPQALCRQGPPMNGCSSCVILQKRLEY